MAGFEDINKESLVALKAEIEKTRVSLEEEAARAGDCHPLQADSYQGSVELLSCQLRLLSADVDGWMVTCPETILYGYSCTVQMSLEAVSRGIACLKVLNGTAVLVTE